MGNALARLEMQIMFTQLLPRVKHMERIGETDYLRSNVVHGIKRLPVRVEFE
jgi:cytochrome P450